MTTEETKQNVSPSGQADAPLDTIFTWANLATFIRLLLIPVFFFVFLSDIPNHDLIAFVIFAIAASTDWVDGQIARRTNTVSKFGQQFDPVVDRFLIGFGVIGVYCAGRAPLWVFLLIVARDLSLAFATSILRDKTGMEMCPVIFLGKMATAFILTGFSSLILNWPMVPGLGIIESAALPGFGSAPVAIGIFLVYIGLLCSITTMFIYFYKINGYIKSAQR